MKKPGKYLIHVIFLLFLIALTFFLLFKDQDLKPVIRILGEVPVGYVILGLLLVVIYVCSESVIIKYLLKAVGVSVKLLNCIRYSFIGFFFSCITPSASGGQPAQIVYMREENVNIPSATIVLMLVTIEYKFVLVFTGVALVLFGQSILQAFPAEALFYLYLGLALNVICIAIMIMLVFFPKTMEFVINGLCNLLQKIKFIKKKEKLIKRIQNSVANYSKASEFLKKNYKAIVVTTLITFVQRFALFTVTYVVYRSLGLNKASFIEITLLQASISVAVDMLPLPGGMGISERIFNLIFVPMFGTVDIMLSGMLISRGISYYSLLILSGIITLFSHITIMSKKNKQGGHL